MTNFTTKELWYLNYAVENLLLSCPNPKFEKAISDLSSKIEAMIDIEVEKDILEDNHE